MSPYKILDHTADLRIEVKGKGIEGLFVSSAEALTDLLVDIDSVDRKYNIEISANGDNRGELLVDFLRELLFLFSVKGKIFSKFDIIKLSDKKITARCFGEDFDPKRHELKIEIKAITYHGLEITESNGVFWVSIIFDV
jgi:SHS2 domain-containing protein